MSTGKTPRRIAALLVLALALTGAAAAQGGAGGLLFGLVQPTWNPKFMPQVAADLPELEFMGGFGYGVTRDDFIIGGFGIAFLDDTIYDDANWSMEVADPSFVHAAGGVGGMGVSTRSDDESWISNGVEYAWYDASGYFIGYVEPCVEAGLGVTPWFHVGATLSYPAIANIIPGRPLSDLLWYSPSLGVTLSFGRFRSY